MTGQTLIIGRWPNDRPSFATGQNLLIATVDTKKTLNRDAARRLVRSALCELLGRHLGSSAADIELVSTPGQPIRLNKAGTSIGLSVSHESDLSVLAIHLAGPIGIDLLRISAAPVWQADIPHLARDYLGAEIAEQLAARPLGEQGIGFAEAWTSLEARLKCLNKGLQEWHPTRQRELSRCACFHLKLPAGLVGTVAVPLAKSAGRNV